MPNLLDPVPIAQQAMNPRDHPADSGHTATDHHDGTVLDYQKGLVKDVLSNIQRGTMK